MTNKTKYYVMTIMQVAMFVMAGQYLMLKNFVVALLMLIAGLVVGYIQIRQVTYAGYAVAQLEKEEYLEELRRIRHTLFHQVQTSDESRELNDLLSDITSNQVLNPKIVSLQKFNRDHIATIALKDGSQILVLANTK